MPFGFGVVQRSLTIGPANDKFEREADHVSSTVAGGHNMPATMISRVPEAGHESISRASEHDPKSDSAPVQRSTQGEIEEQHTYAYGPASGEIRDTKPLIQKTCAECSKESSSSTGSSPVQLAPQGEVEEHQLLVPSKSRTQRSTETPPVQRAPQGAAEEHQPATNSPTRAQRSNEPPPVQRACAGCDHEAATTNKAPAAQRKEEAMSKEPAIQKTPRPGGGTGRMQAAAAQVISSKSPGSPLPAPIRSTLESRTGADFSGVRVHSDAKAHAAASALHAKAFTHRSDIWLARGQSATDLPLMAHELTHVVQQGAVARRKSDTVQRATEKQADPPVQLAEAMHKDDAVQRSNAGVVQRDSWLKKAWQATGGKIVDEAGNVLEMGETLAMQVLDEFAPQFAAVVRDIKTKGGVFEYMKDKVFGVARDIFKGAKEDKGTLGKVFAMVEKLQEGGKKIIAGLKSNDCKPLFDAMSQLGDMAMELAGEAWDAIKDFFRPIGDFFTDIWDNYLSKAMDKVSDLAGKAWQGIKDFGKRVWDWTEPVRNKLSAAWDWIKKKLGVGEGPDNQDGLLQWASKKIGEAWQWLLKALDPVIQPMKKLWEKVKAIIPIEKIIHLRATVHDWLGKMKKMLSNVQKKDDVVENQDSLRKEILPAVKTRIYQLKDKVAEAGAWVAGEIGGAAGTVKEFLGGLQSNSILSVVSGAFTWLQQKVDDLAAWATTKVQGVFAFLGNGLDRLAGFVEPLYDTLEKMLSVVGNVMKKLPDLVLGPFWAAIPKCITDPVRDWIIENVLSQIPVIGALLTDKTIWPKLKDFAIDLLKTLFVKGDLSGAALKVFRFFLETIGIDVDLMLRVFAKTLDRLDEVLMDPMKFLKNLGAAIWQGLQKFLDNIAKHLFNGLLGWLLGPLDKLGITGIKDLSLGSILDLVLQILGITEGKIRSKLEKAVGPTALDILERAWKLLKALWDGGPAALWEEIKSQLSDLQNLIIGGITQWITKEVIEAGIAYLIKLSNPVGAVIQIIQSIYEVVKTVVQKANQIMQVVDSVLDGIGDIMNGVIDGAATMVEAALGRAVPVAISFIANLVGIDDPAPAMQKIVKDIQAKVDKAMDWLVDKFKAMVSKVGGAIKSAAGAVAALLFPKKTFTAGDEQHIIEAEQAGEDYKIVVHSKTVTIEDVITEASKLDTAKDDASALRKAYDKFKGLHVGSDKKKGADAEKQLKDQEDKKLKQFGIVADLIAKIYPKVPALTAKKRETHILYGTPDSRLGGTMMVAHPLAEDSLKEGSKPSQSADFPPIWAGLYQQKRDGRRLYIKGHLLNQRLGGPGDLLENITPFTYSANSSHEKQVESDLKDLIKKNSGKMAHYEVHVNFPSGPRAPQPDVLTAELELATSISTHWYELEDKKGTLTQKGGDHKDTIQNVPPYPHA